MSKTNSKMKIHKRRTTLELSVRNFLEGLNQFQNFTNFPPQLNKMGGKAKNRNLLLNHCSKFNVISDINPLSKLDKGNWGQCSYPETLVYQKKSSYSI